MVKSFLSEIVKNSVEKCRVTDSDSESDSSITAGLSQHHSSKRHRPTNVTMDTEVSS